LKASEKKPEIRCGIIQQGIKALDSLKPLIKKRIMDRYPKDILQVIRETKENDWLPLEFDLQFAEFLLDELSKEEFYNFCLDSNKASIKTSVMGPIIRSALNLFRISPSTILKWIPIIFNNCYRNCGDVSVIKTGKNSLEVSFNDLPPEFVGNKDYLIAMTAFIKALDVFIEIGFAVVLKEQSITNRRAVIEVSWELGK
jgi:hypothetical protein